MSDINDMIYYSRREKTERELADRTSDPLLSSIHREMADLYLARLTHSPVVAHLVVEMSPTRSTWPSATRVEQDTAERRHG